MLLTTLCTGEEVHRYKKSIVLFLNGPRKVLSTAPHNGGYREDLTVVFNNDGTVGAGMAATLMAPTYQEHVALLAEQLGLDPAKAAGITTAAQMENVSIVSASYNELTVTAIVTGGVEVNGGRAGDPATWDEILDQAIENPAHGTINIILHINVDLTEGALARALVTCTEAKSVALPELAAPSRYSMGLATGSGTDGTIIVACADSAIQLMNSGKHCKLGELIGVTVKQAVTEALALQTGMTPERQHHVIQRLERFGITEDYLYECYRSQGFNSLDRAHFAERVALLFKEFGLVVPISLVAHLLDQMAWGLISPDEAVSAAAVLLQDMGMPTVPKTGADALHRILSAVSDGLLEVIEAGEPLPQIDVDRQGAGTATVLPSAAAGEEDSGAAPMPQLSSDEDSND